MIYNVIGFIVGIVGIFITWLVTYVYYRKQSATDEKQKDEEIAKYVVMSMSHQYPVHNSQELRLRIDKYLDALKRTKEDKRGVPTYRGDGSIGVDWSLRITDTIHMSDSATANQHKETES